MSIRRLLRLPGAALVIAALFMFIVVGAASATHPRPKGAA